MQLAKRIYCLRTENGLSREKLAEILGVSKQAVQKWESGKSTPGMDKLIKLSQQFRVSLDSLICDTNVRIAENEQKPDAVTPDYASIANWEAYSKNLSLEIEQSTDEGLDVERFRDVFRAVEKMDDGPEKDQMANVLFSIIGSAKMKNDYPYVEPSDIQNIRLCRKEHLYKGKKPSGSVLEEKIRGAWYGRMGGCLLGKTVECMTTDELIPMLTETGNYPMKRYIRRSDITDEMLKKYRFNLKWSCYADKVKCAPADDDTNYTVLAQTVIEKYGKDFKPDNVGSTWLAMQPKDAYCTAERVAYRNLVNGFRPPNTAIYKNPYREWIGAQIRADYYGYINPGNPQLAAEMAWRDASISHIKNGIYGAMFVAAMLACAAVSSDVKEVILCGLGEIPQQSRLHQRVSEVLGRFESGERCDKVMAYVHQLFNEYSSHGWCHTISNAMIVTAALLYGGGDYGKSICLAVQTGFDTDCNGATVGSIVGMMYGISRIGREWTAPLGDRLDTHIFGHENVKTEDLIKKTLEHISK